MSISPIQNTQLPVIYTFNKYKNAEINHDNPINQMLPIENTQLPVILNTYDIIWVNYEIKNINWTTCLKTDHVNDWLEYDTDSANEHSLEGHWIELAVKMMLEDEGVVECKKMKCYMFSPSSYLRCSKRSSACCVYYTSYPIY